MYIYIYIELYRYNIYIYIYTMDIYYGYIHTVMLSSNIMTVLDLTVLILDGVVKIDFDVIMLHRHMAQERMG